MHLDNEHNPTVVMSLEIGIHGEKLLNELLKTGDICVVDCVFGSNFSMTKAGFESAVVKECRKTIELIIL